MKKAIRNLLVLLAVGLAACSCTTTYYAKLYDRDFNPEGRTYRELVDFFGLPSREANIGDDAYIVTFTGDRVFDYKPSKFGQITPELQCYMDSETDTCYRSMVNNDQSRGVFSPGKTAALIIVLLVGLGIL